MSRGPAVIATSLLLALSTLTGPARADVAVNQWSAMPASGTFTLTGHGYGHGHGMSQYGAEGAARQGRTWQDIVRFYYPGTTPGQNRRRVYVLITADTGRNLVVRARSGLRLIDTATRESQTLPDNGASRWRLGVSDGRSVVDFLRDGRWRRWRTLAGLGKFTAGYAPMTLYAGGTTRNYRGILFSARPTPRSTDRDTVNIVAIDTYLRGVVPREMPASWSQHALRAQAVAARTYASRQVLEPQARHYQICDTTACQVYGGASSEDSRTNRAIAATAGEILLHEGIPAFTQFSSSSGGWTSANQFSYLPAQEDPHDGWAGNPNHTWTKTVDVARVENLWPALGNLRGIRVTSRDGNGQWQGRVLRITLDGSRNDVSISGNTFRSRLGLKSTWWAVTATREG